MSYLVDMPHTKNYDQDLGWLICAYKKLLPIVAELKDRVAALEDLYESIPEEIAQGLAKMQEQLNAAIAEMERKINDTIEEVEQNVDEKINEINGKMESLEVLVNDKIIEINEIIDQLKRTYADIKNYVDREVDFLHHWVKAYIAEAEKTWPWLIDPVDGNVEDMQTILYHMYNYFGDGIPVIEFDGLQITAEMMDSKNIEAVELDRYGRKIFDEFKHFMMLSPFTGILAPIRDVVLDLARLHQNAVTAQEFDNGDLDVEMFDEKNVRAYDFDWTSVWFDELSGNGGN